MKVLVLYGSLTGNTEFVANQIADFLNHHHIKNDLFNAQEFSPKNILTYDLLILGSSTWDYGQFQEDFAAFFEEIKELAFNNKQFIVFGCGDSGYENFCKAVDLIEDFLTLKQAKKIGDSLKIDGYPQQSTNQQLINAWLTTLVKSLT